MNKTADVLDEKFTLCQQVALMNSSDSVYRFKQSRAALMNTTLICIVQRQDQKKILRKLFPSEIHSYKRLLQLYRDLFGISTNLNRHIV